MELLRALVEEKTVVRCLKDPLLDPDVALKEELSEIGIEESQFARITVFR